MSCTQLHFCWENQHPTFTSSFKNLLDSGELADVTLSAEGQPIKAHKVILSACSPYFKKLFSEDPSKSSVVIQDDVKFQALKTVIDFVYCGEINTSDQKLPDILKAAEVLQIRYIFDASIERKKNQGFSKRKKQKLSEDTVSPGVSTAKINNCALNETEEASKTVPSSSAIISSDEDESEDNTDIQTWQDRECINDIKSTLCWIGYLERLEALGRGDNSESKQTQSPSSKSKDAQTADPFPRRIIRRNGSIQRSKDFRSALEAVRSGEIGFCKAAKIFGVNPRTLNTEYKKRGYPQIRRQPEGLRRKQAGEMDSDYYDSEQD